MFTWCASSSARFVEATAKLWPSVKVHMEGPLAVVVIAALLCLVVPFELSQLVFMVIGAVSYALLQTVQPTTKRAAGGSGKSTKGQTTPTKPSSVRKPATATATSTCTRAPGSLTTRAAPRPELRTPSSMPISAPKFQSVGWEAEVQELLRQIAPTPESDRIVQQLAAAVKQTLRRAIPEVEVLGFASGDLARGRAFGVAVPDVDIVINVSPQVLVARLQGRLAQGRTVVANLDSRRLQKSAIRVCTDKLVTQGGFKFRRSAFRGQEPKVTLLAPASLGILDAAVPIDFTVNSLTPLYNAALLTECGRIDARAKSLILLVKRWTKDRGICHAAKGHLPPYTWSLLTIYYLQVSEERVLPPLAEFEVSSGLMTKAAAAAPKPERQPNKAPQATVGELLKGFMHFYSQRFDWRNEAVCIRLGERAAPHLRLPLHIILHENQSTSEVGLSVEDPFDGSNNLGACMNASSLTRLREEFHRASTLCSEGASLSSLLEPWIPPEHESLEQSREECGEEPGMDGPNF